MKALTDWLDRLQPETRQIVCGSVVGAAFAIAAVALAVWSLAR